MADTFSITARLQVAGPYNVQPVVNALESQLRGVTATITPKLHPSTNRSFTNLKKDLDVVNSALTIAQNNVSALSGAFKTVSINPQTVQSLNSIRSSVKQNTTAATGLKTSFNDASTAAFRFGQDVGLAARKFGAFILVVKAVDIVQRSFSRGVREAISFQNEMVRLSQISGTTKQSIAAISGEITNLSTNLGTSSISLAEVSTTLLQAGFAANEVKAGLSALAKTTLAPTFKSLENTTEGLIAMRQQFKLTANDYESALGAINTVSAAFAVESDDLVTAIRKTGGAFKSASGDMVSSEESFNQLLALFTSVRSTTRESADEIATGLRTIFGRLQSNRVAASLKELGINLRFTSEEARLSGEDIQGEFVGAYEAIRRLSTAVRGLPTTDPRFAQIVEQVGGYRQISRVIPLLQQFGTAQRAYTVAQAGANSLTQDAIKNQASFQTQLTKVKEEFFDLIRVMGDNKNLQGFLASTLKLAEAAIKLTKAMEPLLPLLMAFAAVKITKGFVEVKNGIAARFRETKAATGALKGHQSGGVVGGTGSGDTVPANLPAGSFVIRKQSARRIGYDRLRDYAKGQRFQSGGKVPVLLEPQEFVFTPQEVRNAGGYGVMRQLNRGDVIDDPRTRLAHKLKKKAMEQEVPVWGLMQKKYAGGGIIGETPYGRIKRTETGRVFNLDKFLENNVGQRVRLRRLDADPMTGEPTPRAQFYARHRQARFLKKLGVPGHADGGKVRLSAYRKAFNMTPEEFAKEVLGISMAPGLMSRNVTSDQEQIIRNKAAELGVNLSGVTSRPTGGAAQKIIRTGISPLTQAPFHVGPYSINLASSPQTMGQEVATGSSVAGFQSTPISTSDPNVITQGTRSRPFVISGIRPNTSSRPRPFRTFSSTLSPEAVSSSGGNKPPRERTLAAAASPSPSGDFGKMTKLLEQLLKVTTEGVKKTKKADGVKKEAVASPAKISNNPNNAQRQISFYDKTQGIPSPDEMFGIANTIRRQPIEQRGGIGPSMHQPSLFPNEPIYDRIGSAPLYQRRLGGGKESTANFSVGVPIRDDLSFLRRLSATSGDVKFRSMPELKDLRDDAKRIGVDPRTSSLITDRGGASPEFIYDKRKADGLKAADKAKRRAAKNESDLSKLMSPGRPVHQVGEGAPGAQGIFHFDDQNELLSESRRMNREDLIDRSKVSPEGYAINAKERREAEVAAAGAAKRGELGPIQVRPFSHDPSQVRNQDFLFPINDVPSSPRDDVAEEHLRGRNKSGKGFVRNPSLSQNVAFIRNLRPVRFRTTPELKELRDAARMVGHVPRESTIVTDREHTAKYFEDNAAVREASRVAEEEAQARNYAKDRPRIGRVRGTLRTELAKRLQQTHPKLTDSERIDRAHETVRRLESRGGDKGLEQALSSVLQRNYSIFNNNQDPNSEDARGVLPQTPEVRKRAAEYAKRRVASVNQGDSDLFKSLAAQHAKVLQERNSKLPVGDRRVLSGEKLQAASEALARRDIARNPSFLAANNFTENISSTDKLTGRTSSAVYSEATQARIDASSNPNRKRSPRQPRVKAQTRRVPGEEYGTFMEVPIEPTRRDRITNRLGRGFDRVSNAFSSVKYNASLPVDRFKIGRAFGFRKQPLGLSAEELVARTRESGSSDSPPGGPSGSPPIRKPSLLRRVGNKTNQLGFGLRNNALMFSFFAPQLLEQGFGTIANPIGGNVASAKYAKAAGGAITTGAIGSQIGSLFGPMGTVVGAAVGALSGFVGSLNQANNELAEIDFGKKFAKFSNSIDSIASGRLSARDNLGRIHAGVAEAASEASRRVKVQGGGGNFFDRNLGSYAGFLSAGNEQIFKDEDKARRSKFTEILSPQLSSFHQIGDQLASEAAKRVAQSDITHKTGTSQTDLNASRDNRLKAFDELGGGKIAETISRISNVPVAQVREQFDAVIKSSARLNLQQKEGLKVVTAATIQTTKFQRLGAAVEAAANSILTLQQSADTIHQLFEGSISPGRVSGFAEGAGQFGGPDQQAFQRSVSFTQNSLGGQLAGNFGQAITQLDQVSRDLPDVLTDALRGSNFSENSLPEDIKNTLTQKFGPEVGGRLASGVDSIDPQELIARISGGNSAKFADDLFKMVFGDLPRVFADTTRQVQDGVNRFADGLTQAAQAQQKIGETLDRIPQQQLGLQRAQASLSATKLGRSPEDFLSLDQLRQPFVARQQRLAGADGLDPTKIAGQFAGVRQRIVDQDRIINTPTVDSATRAAAQIEKTGLSGQAANLQKALEHLADTSGELSAIQEKLNAVERERASQLSLTERLITSDPSQLRELNKGAFAAQAATQQGDFRGFNATNIRGALEFLRSVGDAKLQNGRTGNQQAEQLLAKSAPFLGINTIKTQRSREALGGQMVGVEQRGKLALEELAKIQSGLNNDFISELKKQNSTFLSLLDILIQAETTKDLKGAKRRAEENESKARSVADRAGKLNDQFATGPGDNGLQRARDLLNAPSLDRLKEVNQDLSTVNKSIADPSILGGIEKKFASTTPSRNKQHDVTTLFGHDIPRLNTFAGLTAEETAKFLEDHRSALDNATPDISQKLGIPESNVRDAHAAYMGRLKDVSEGKTILDGSGNPVKVFQPGSELVSAYGRARSNHLGQLNEDQTRLTNDISQEVYGNRTPNFDEAKRIRDAANDSESLNSQLKGLEGVTEVKDAKTQLESLAEVTKAATAALAAFTKTQQPAIEMTGPPVLATGHARGGSIFKPKGTDTVPAMLTPGEFVVNAQASKANRELLERINRASGPVEYHEGGGVAGRRRPLTANFFDLDMSPLEALRPSVEGVLDPIFAQGRRNMDFLPLRGRAMDAIKEANAAISDQLTYYKGPFRKQNSELKQGIKDYSDTSLKDFTKYRGIMRGMHHDNVEFQRDYAPHNESVQDALVERSRRMKFVQRDIDLKVFLANQRRTRNGQAQTTPVTQQSGVGTAPLVMTGPPKPKLTPAQEVLRLIERKRQTGEDFSIPTRTKTQHSPDTMEVLQDIFTKQAGVRQPRSTPINRKSQTFFENFSKSIDAKQVGSGSLDQAVKVRNQLRKKLADYQRTGNVEGSKKSQELLDKFSAKFDKSITEENERRSKLGQVGLGLSGDRIAEARARTARRGLSQDRRQTARRNGLSTNPFVNFRQRQNDLIRRQRSQFNRRLSRNFADGGVVPRGTDTVPAMLTPGEFVVDRDTTAAHLPLLQRLSRPTYRAKGGLIGNEPGSASEGAGRLSLSDDATGSLKEFTVQFGKAVQEFATPISQLANISQGLGQSIQTLSGSLGTLDTSAKNLAGLMPQFADAASTLAKALASASIPSVIKVQTNSQVEVVLNGAAIIAALKGDMAKEVTNAVLGRLDQEVKRIITEMPAK